MSPTSTKPRQSLAKCLCIATAFMIQGCGPRLTKPSPGKYLLELACPENLGPLRDDSFGATTVKLHEVIGQYRICRAAALTEAQPK